MSLPKLPDTPINLALNFGGLGDDICRLPALKYVLDKWPHAKITLACADFYRPVIEHFFAGRLEKIYGMSEIFADRALMNRKWLQTKTEFFTPMHSHLADHAFSYIADEINIPIEHKNYLQFDLARLPDVSKFSLPEDYVVFTPGYTAPVRALPARTYNGISTWLRARGITPVFLGTKLAVRGGLAEKIEATFDSDLDGEGAIDLREKTVLLEAAHILAKAKVVIGLDNGLVHLAACSQVPIIVAYTNLDPSLRLPIRNNELGWNCKVIRPPGCHTCESSTNFMPLEQDFRHCVWPEMKCSEKLTADLFIKELECILK